MSDYGPDFGIGLSSPQLPGLVSGSADLDDLTPEFVFGIAVEAGLSPSGDIVAHYEHVFDVDGQVFAVRMKRDALTEQRARVAERVDMAIRQLPDLRAYVVPDSLDICVVIVALDSERVDDVTSSLGPVEPATLAAFDEEADEISCLALLRGVTENAHRRLDSLGLHSGSTVRDLFDALDGNDSHDANDESIRELEPLLV